MKIKTFVVAGMLAGTLLCPAAELELTGKTDREEALYPAGDTAFFAERIDPDAAFFVSTGLFDNSAHSSSVAAVFNSFRGKTENWSSFKPVTECRERSMPTDFVF